MHCCTSKEGICAHTCAGQAGGRLPLSSYTTVPVMLSDQMESQLQRTAGHSENSL